MKTQPKHLLKNSEKEKKDRNPILNILIGLEDPQTHHNAFSIKMFLPQLGKKEERKKVIGVALE